jgi:hypothetical protein
VEGEAIYFQEVPHVHMRRSQDDLDLAPTIAALAKRGCNDQAALSPDCCTEDNAWSNGKPGGHSLLYTGGCSAERVALGVNDAWWMGGLVFLSCVS